MSKQGERYIESAFSADLVDDVLNSVLSRMSYAGSPPERLPRFPHCDCAEANRRAGVKVTAQHYVGNGLEMKRTEVNADGTCKYCQHATLMKVAGRATRTVLSKDRPERTPKAYLMSLWAGDNKQPAKPKRKSKKAVTP